MAYLSPGEWDLLLADALAGRFDTAFQPIVDLREGHVAGYEALARFGGPASLRPDHWFRAARAHGVVARLDAAAISAAVARARELPESCFLSVNVEPDSIGHPSVDQALRSAGALDRLVIELTEHIPVEADGHLERRLGDYRQLGARVAVDDAGSGYSGLQHIVRFHPAVVKLDRALVSRLDSDEVKLALVEMLCVFAERIDAVVLAEGVERPEEADALRSVGVPLAQGFFFGRPERRLGELSAEGRSFFGARRVDRPATMSWPRRLASLAALLEQAPTVPAEQLLHTRLGELGDGTVVLDRSGRPIGVLGPDGHHRQVLAVKVSAPLAEVALSMLARPADQRFAPLLCEDDDGRYLGVLSPAQVMAELARLAGAGAPDALASSVLGAVTG